MTSSIPPKMWGCCDKVYGESVKAKGVEDGSIWWRWMKKEITEDQSQGDCGAIRRSNWFL